MLQQNSSMTRCLVAVAWLVTITGCDATVLAQGIPANGAQFASILERNQAGRMNLRPSSASLASSSSSSSTATNGNKQHKMRQEGTPETSLDWDRQLGISKEKTLNDCEAMYPYSNLNDDAHLGIACECTTNGHEDAVLTCHDKCNYCNDDQSVCATKSMASARTSTTTLSTSTIRNYTYTKGFDGVLEFETTGCDGISICSACSVSFQGEPCNSCTPIQCAGSGVHSYPSFEMDCSNIHPNASISLCHPPTLDERRNNGLLQILVPSEFSTCVRDPLDVCHSVKDYQMESLQYICECYGSSSNSSATLTCSDPNCPRSCNRDYTVCWNNSFATIFDADGQPSSTLDIKTYVEGRDEVVIWEGRGSYSNTCSMTVNGVACNSCGTTMCEQDYEAEAFDCDNIERGASFDTCRGAGAEGQAGVLQAFNDNQVESCMRISDPQALCRKEAERPARWGTTCDCALDTLITGEDYILTCEGSCLSCNDEATVCAHQTSSFKIGKYGQQQSRVRSYTFVSGGRNETVIVGGLDIEYDGFGKDCYVTVNDIPCNSCGPVTCPDQGYFGIGVDCENIVPGASYDTCNGEFVVDTGVFEVLSPYEFRICHSNQTFEDRSDFGDS
jgi:hypothetical protein